MRALGRWGAGALGVGMLIVAASCNEIGSPIREGYYGYSIIVADVVAADTTIDGVDYNAGSTITDTVDFAWPGSALPIKIWVQDTAGLPGHMTAAVAAWKNVLVYGEFDATMVGDSAKADIIVSGTVPPATPAPEAGRRLRASSADIVACEGVTDFSVSAPDHTKLWTPIRVYITPKFAIDDPLTVDCMARVSIHELGHALGLFRHSPDPLDIMYTFPDTSVHAPSEGDATTILTLYHQHSDLRPRPATDTLPPDTLGMVR